MKILLSTVLLATVGLTGCVVAPIDDRKKKDIKIYSTLIKLTST